MRRIARISRPVEKVLEQSSRRVALPASVCNACQVRAAPFTTAARRDAAKEKKPYTEKLRQKIWGTENAPGREDPYSYDSPMRSEEETELAVKPAEEETPVKPQAPAIDMSGYQPATTWEGLEVIGGEEWLEQKVTPRGFKGFLPEEKASTLEGITAAVRRSLVEVFKARAEGKQLRVWRAKSPAEDWTVNMHFKALENNGNFELVEGPESSKKGSESWRQVPLSEPEIKFAVIKRVMQLTGLRVFDSVINDLPTAGALVSSLSKYDKRLRPEKVAEWVETTSKYNNLKNVTFSGRRVTPIDKEKAVGRWKVIEQKLIDRDLPVTGRDI
ncbi:uncharacterized protein K452DRAFT_295514 [Aplosporella prunicola CBS 121167]|uniref:Large ribosomal subunit protein mL50 n=1 Tax=Aplosporella prunicola CBS 121167 TaxID=1176127 RepID=A0A6A6BLF7_9PEZI|nr:uncharacterized protein K452DRAFT_295514 [Aplosporella prunicola CBS 121167]KAF2144949.1 hypothetical protein K452DRAFT_295514 [Aplosporella prunicola CBS 121167]